MKDLSKLFPKYEAGASAVEYGLIVGLIAAVAVATLLTMGQDLGSLFEAISGNLGTAVSGAAPGGS